MAGVSRESTPVLKLEDLVIKYYTLSGIVHAVRGVSFEVNCRESVCLVGESGSGKSTVGLAIAHALPPNARVSGRILFKGEDVTRLNGKRLSKFVGREVTIIFQDPAATFNPLFTIGEQLMDVLRTHKGGKERDEEELRREAIELLGRVGLPDPERVFKSYPHELSGGMLQRASIAVALSPNPSLLVADEPTTMLDVTLQAQILDLLTRLKEELGLSMLFITHNLGVAAEVCDRVVILYAGKVLEVGSVEEVLLNPLHPYTRKLLECVPRAFKSVGRLKHIPGSLPDPRRPPPGCPFQPRCDEALPECSASMPPLREVRPGHLVACHKYSGQEAGVG